MSTVTTRTFRTSERVRLFRKGELREWWHIRGRSQALEDVPSKKIMFVLHSPYSACGAKTNSELKKKVEYFLLERIRVFERQCLADTDPAFKAIMPNTSTCKARQSRRFETSPPKNPRHPPAIGCPRIRALAPRSAPHPLRNSPGRPRSSYGNAVFGASQYLHPPQVACLDAYEPHVIPRHAAKDFL